MIEYLITSLCLSLTTPAYSNACSPTLTAMSIQTEIKPMVDRKQKEVEKQAIRITGEDTWKVGAAAYQVANLNKIQYSTPLRPICDRINLSHIDQESRATFIWEIK